MADMKKALKRVAEKFNETQKPLPPAGEAITKTLEATKKTSEQIRSGK